MSRNPTRPGPLVAIAAAGHGVAWLLSVIVAQSLGVEGFEAYALASALFIVMATLAPLGSEKHALRHLPAMLARGDLGLAHGFLRFGLGRTVAVAFAAALAVAAWALVTRPAGDLRLAIWMTCLSLPAGALAHYGVEALTAAGRPKAALLLFRLLVPAVALLLVAVAISGPWQVSGAFAVAAWGIGWAVALAFMAVLARRSLPAGLRAAVPRTRPRQWGHEARPFLAYRVSLSLLSQAPLLALELLGTGPGEVGAFAAAMGTVGLVGVLATSTNRAYGRDLGLLLEQRDFDGLLRARRARLRWLAPMVMLFLVLMVGFAAPILALFRPEFVAEGVLPLRLLSLSMAFTVLFALAPTYLKFQRRNAITYRVVSLAALAQILLLLLLVPRLGATGAALAYLLSMGGMYGSFALMAKRELVRLQGEVAG